MFRPARAARFLNQFFLTFGWVATNFAFGLLFSVSGGLFEELKVVTALELLRVDPVVIAGKLDADVLSIKKMVSQVEAGERIRGGTMRCTRPCSICCPDPTPHAPRSRQPSRIVSPQREQLLTATPVRRRESKQVSGPSIAAGWYVSTLE